MLCNYVNPEMVQAAKLARAEAFRTATTADEYEDAAESQTEDYIPLCWCSKCVQEA